MNSSRSIINKAVLAAILALSAGQVSALTLVADYSDVSVGSIWQTTGGQLQSSDPGSGAIDVTANFKLNVAAAFTYLQNSILVPWTETVTFKLFDFKAAAISADGDSAIDHVDGNGRPDMSTIRLDSSDASHFYVDATPFDNSEYDMNVVDATLGGSSVNVGRFGSSVVGGIAENRTDVLTLLLHELVHSAGFNFLDRFDNLAGPVGTDNRKITVPTTLTGFASDFDLPFISASDHVDPVAAGGIFAHAITSEPSFGENDRWLPTGAELYALCQVEGCAANEINPNLVASPVPVSGAFWLMASAGLGLAGMARRRKQAGA